MKNTLAALLLLIAISIQAQQLYDKSGGLRLGNTSGLTFKSFTTEDEAIELIVSGRNEGLQVSVMYLFHNPMEFSFNDRFYLHYGLGGHVGFEKFDDIAKTLINNEGDQFAFEERTFFTMGVDTNLGLEYRWLEVPVTLGFDIKPFFSFIGMRHTRAQFWDAAISFKYVF